MKREVYQKVVKFLRRNPGTIAWRISAHCKIAERYLNDDEEVLYAFAAQKGPSAWDVFSTHVLVITDKRLVVAQKRLIFGHFYYTITPDMFNDFTIKMGLIWGRAIVDTIKETVVLSNLSKGALKEVETVLSKYMMQKKRELENGVNENDVEKLKQELTQISKKGEK
ncbi:MAG: PH domain-containing protein [Bacilli bacterium]|nr:PH domain-containing protein [Bacilli bacterium]